MSNRSLRKQNYTFLTCWERKSSIIQICQSYQSLMISKQLVQLLNKLYQLYRLFSSILYASLVMRWLVLYPLVGAKFLPGGIHEFLCYSMVCCSTVELLWLFRFHGIVKGVCSRTLFKDLNFLYFVLVMHYYDDYEHAPILKTQAYSMFIVALGCSQAYCHWCNLFKGGRTKNYSIICKINNLVTLPLLYSSEFYLLLLNVQNPSFHSTPLLDTSNKIVLVLFLPIALSFYRKQF